MARGQSKLTSGWMLAVCGVLGLGLGLLSRTVRPFLHYREIYWEAVASLVLLVVTVAALAVANRRMNAWRGLAMLETETLLLWAGFVVGWSVVEGQLWIRLAEVCAMWCAGCGVGGAAVQLVARRLWPPRDWPTRNCPGCDYLLVGLTEKRCPECGRPFTLEELGVTEADLRV